MSKRIYVGNLPWSVTRDKLLELFKSFGEIEDGLVIANKYTGRSRGFGFVTFKNDADADKAIKEMNRKEVEGRKIVVKEARPLRGEEEKAEESKSTKTPQETEAKEKPTAEKEEKAEESQ